MTGRSIKPYFRAVFGMLLWVMGGLSAQAASTCLESWPKLGPCQDKEYDLSSLKPSPFENVATLDIPDSALEQAQYSVAGGIGAESSPSPPAGDLPTSFNLAQENGAARQTESAPDPWRVEFRPYLEVPFSVNGRFEIDRGSDNGNGGGGNGGGPELPPIDLPIEAGFDLSNFFLLGGELQVWHNDFGIVLDGFYADLGTRVLVGSENGNSIDSGVELGASYTRVAAALGWHAGTFRQLPEDMDVNPEDVYPAVSLELLAGAEYVDWSVDATLFDSVDLGLSPSWVAPGLGLNADFLLDSRTTLFVENKIGGFGIGNAPNFNWSLQAGLDWRFLPNVSFRPSYVYRSSFWQSSDGKRTIDLATQGVWAGFSFYF